MSPHAKKSYSRRGFVALAGAAAISAVGAGGAYAFAHRPVEVSLNGASAQAPFGSTLAELMKSRGLSPVAGNLLSIGGNLVAEGEGTLLSALVNGEAMKPEEALAYVLQRGDVIEVADGEDLTEDFETSTKSILPKLVFGGDDYGAIQYVSQWGTEGVQEIRTGLRSGEVIEGDFLTEAQDCIVTTCSVHPDGDKKLVGLSFDDGPSEYTERYLDILKQHGATATFFTIGRNIDALGGDLPTKVIAQGSFLGSHTYSHPPLTSQSASQVVEELQSTRGLINGAASVDTTMLRPPYGDFSSQVWLESAGLVTSRILWTHDTLDWKQPGADSIAEAALANVKPGSVILMHDGGGKRDQDLEALPKILKGLSDAGYKAVSIQELLASDSSIPHAVALGTASLPEGAVWPTEIA